MLDVKIMDFDVDSKVFEEASDTRVSFKEVEDRKKLDIRFITRKNYHGHLNENELMYRLEDDSIHKLRSEEINLYNEDLPGAYNTTSIDRLRGI